MRDTLKMLPWKFDTIFSLLTLKRGSLNLNIDKLTNS